MNRMDRIFGCYVYRDCHVAGFLAMIRGWRISPSPQPSPIEGEGVIDGIKMILRRARDERQGKRILTLGDRNIPSFPRKRESIQLASIQLTYNQTTWIPAKAGMTDACKAD